MKRMKLVVMSNNHSHETHTGSDGSDGGGGGGVVGGGSGGGKYECDNCRADFPNKTTLDRHALFCRTLAEIRRGGSGGVSMPTHNDPLMPTSREMFILIQELAAKYNKVKDELDVMKQWAKMVGRRVGAASVAGGAGAGGAGGAAGLDFTSITRQKRQNMEVILNEEDAEHPELAEARPSFAEWVATLDAMTRTDLNVVFHEDLVVGITAAILRVLSGHTAESGRSHLIPFKLADMKQGGFYIYDTAFVVVAAASSAGAEVGQDPPTRRWRTMEPCEFQLMVRTFHKLLFKEFKKWQDENWEAQREMTKQRQKAASSYKQMMSVADVDAAAAADAHAAADADIEEDVEPTTPMLSEDFATLYNKYADKMMGGALSDDTILTRVRAKLWKDMKAWRL